jgi:hypothetical protein
VPGTFRNHVSDERLGNVPGTSPNLTRAATRWGPKVRGMPKYVIEREIPGIGEAGAGELQAIAQKSCGVLRDLGPEVQWDHSYVTGDKIYCVYTAAGEEVVREHARRGGFPADSVAQVRTVIDPTTAE